jgi:hypothetical protein
VRTVVTALQDDRLLGGEEAEAYLERAQGQS